MRYATWWAGVWSLAATLGVGLGMLEWSAPVTAIAVLVVAGLAATVMTILTNDLFNPLGVEGSRRRLLARSLAVGAAAVGGFAVLTASPVVALLLVVLAAGTSPPALARLLRRPGLTKPAISSTHGSATTGPRSVQGADQADAQEPEAPPAAALTAMSVHELCSLWRHTFWQLRDEVTPARRASLVVMRQACLEELERRNPTAFSAWLDSGGRASSAPERFMGRPPTHDGPDDV